MLIGLILLFLIAVILVGAASHFLETDDEVRYDWRKERFEYVPKRTDVMFGEIIKS